MQMKSIPPFSVGLLAVSAVLMLFPSLRVAGAMALILAAVYWILMVVLTKNRP